MGIKDIFAKKKKDNQTVVEKSLSGDTSYWDTIRQVQAELSDNPLSEFNKVGDPYFNNVNVYSAVSKKAKSIASVPFRILDQNDEEQENSSLLKIFNNPYPYESQSQLWEAIITNLELHGKAYLICEEFKRNIPTQLWVANSKMMSYELDKKGRISKWIYGYKQKGYRDSYIELDPKQVVFFKYWHPTNPYDGVSPLEAARLNILLQFYSNQYNVNFFKKGGLIKGFFKSTDPRGLTPEQEKTLNKSINEQSSGTGNAHKMPVFRQGIEYVPVGSTQKDMEFTELMNMSRDQILQVFQVPKALVGYTDGFNYANMREIKKDFWNKTLIPLIRFVESVMDTQFFERFGIPYKGRFNIDSVADLQADLNEQVETAKTFFEMGVPFNVINERLGLGFPDLEEGDTNPLNQQTQQMDFQGAVERAIKEKEIKEKIKAEKNLVFDRFLRIKEQNQTVERIIPIEKRIRGKLEKWWKTKFKESMDKLKDEGLKSYKADEDEVDTKLINTYITWLKSQDWGPQFTDEIADDIEDSYNKGAQRTYWGIGADFNLPSSEAQTHIANRGLKLKDSPERIKQEIISALSKDKYTVDELRKTLSKKFNLGESRAKNIAQTETTNAYNAGRTKGMEKLGIKKKQWINSGDSNVRDSHRIESIVNVDQPFVLRDGYKVFYPGDGDPEHSCYCRCSVISVIDDGTEKQLLNTLLGVQEK